MIFTRLSKGTGCYSLFFFACFLKYCDFQIKKWHMGFYVKIKIKVNDLKEQVKRVFKRYVLTRKGRGIK